LLIAATSASTDVLLWSSVLIAAIVLLGVAVFVLRRWLFSTPTSEDAGWSLQHLREMKQRGEITEAEFAALKDKLISSSRRMLGREGAKRDEAGE